MSLPRKRGKIRFWRRGYPRPLGDVASFGDDTPIAFRIFMAIRIFGELPGAFGRGRGFIAAISLIAAQPRPSKRRPLVLDGPGARATGYRASGKSGPRTR